eukprot:4806639-Pyramimonas_sp.AAC.1
MARKSHRGSEGQRRGQSSGAFGLKVAMTAIASRCNWARELAASRSNGGARGPGPGPWRFSLGQ